MANTREEIMEERRRLKAEYRELFNEVSALLFRHDPMNINFATNANEYEPEVGTILPRLRTCGSAQDVHRMVYEEFVRWFGAENAGSLEHYEKIAIEIWKHWQRFNAN
jgi:hypothetical protein